MLACLEVCEKTIKENDPQQDLFLILLNTLKSVCYNSVNAMYAFIKFMIESMKVLGFNFEIDSCACCGAELSNKVFPFSYDYNGMLCAKCSNKNDFLELTLGEFSVLSKINDSSIDALINLKFVSQTDLVSVIGLLVKVFRILTDEELVTIKQFL